MGDNKEDMCSPSGFAFLSGSSESDKQGASDEMESASGFGFLSSPTAPSSTSFGFLNSTSEHTTPIAVSPVPTGEEIKFVGSSASKDIKKKKKKKSLVGYAREDINNSDFSRPSSQTALRDEVQEESEPQQPEEEQRASANVDIPVSAPSAVNEAPTGFSFMGIFRGQGKVSTTKTPESHVVEAVPDMSTSTQATRASGQSDSSKDARPREHASKTSTSLELDDIEKKIQELFSLLCESASTLSSGLESRNRRMAEIDALLSEKSETIQEARVTLKQKEETQQRLAEDEEFERADAFTEPILTLRSNIETNTEELERLLKERANLDGGTELEHRAETEKFRQARSKLATLKTSKKQIISIIMEENMQRQREEEERLATEEERISMEEQHADKERQVIDNELKTTEAAIEQQTGSALKQKQDLECDLLGVSEEITRLEAELKEKIAQRDTILSNLEISEGKINDVRRKYERQLQRIQTRREDVEKTCFECQEERSLLTVATALHEDAVVETRSMQTKLVGWLETMDNEAVVADLFAGVLESFGVEYESPSPTKDDSENMEHIAVQEEVNKCCGALEATITARQNCIDRIELLRAELREIGDKIPKLEAEKKAHALARRFKDAAASANSLKALAVREGEINTECSSMAAECESLDASIQDHRIKHADALKRLNATRKTADIYVLERLLERILSLRRATRDLEEIADKSDGPLALVGPTSAFISAEATIHDSAVRVIRERHDISDHEFLSIEQNMVAALYEQPQEGEESDDVTAFVDENSDTGCDGNHGRGEQDANSRKLEGGAEGCEDIEESVEESTIETATGIEAVVEDELDSNDTKARIAELEEKIDDLVANEDYNGAAEAQEELDKLRLENK